MDSFFDQILEALPEREPNHRSIVAIAGPPAAGKSTVARAVQIGLGAGLIGLDSFHFDDAVLITRGHRERKGAPHTFDIAGYRALLERVRTSLGVEVAIPVFDRSQELSRNAAEIIAADAEVVISEGNWLLLDQPGWRDLRPLFDLTIMLEVDDRTIESRILERWRTLGLDEATCLARAKENDLPNARTVRELSGPADIVLS